MSEHHTALGLWLHGASGRMGREIQQVLLTNRQHFAIIGGSSRTFEGEAFYQGRIVTADLLGDRFLKDKPSIVIDFSTSDGNKLLLDAMREKGVRNLKLLIGTTGISQDVLTEWRSLASELDLTVLVAPNTSIGILLLAQAAIKAALPLARLGFDIEVIETHHRMKKDAPSGTGYFLGSALASHLKDLTVVDDRRGERKKGEIGLHSVRGGGVIGEHEIRMIGDFEEVTLTHRAFSRRLFAEGALVLARWLHRQNSGFYGLLDVPPEDLVSLDPK